MKIIVLICFFILNLWAEIKLENRCVDSIDELSSTQINVLKKAYQYGEPYGFGLTLAAIAWKESCAGEYRVNFQDPSAGIFHAHIPTLLKRYPQLKNDAFTQNRLGELLVRDDTFAAQEAIHQLLYWQKVNHNDWEGIIKSYNKGFSWKKDEQKNKMAMAYLKDVKLRYEQLQSHYLRLFKNTKRNSVFPVSTGKIASVQPQRLTPKPKIIRSFNDGFLEYTLPEKKSLSYNEEFNLITD